MFEFVIPSPWGLFETINRIAKLANIGRISEGDKARGLCHVNLISESPLKKCIVDIELAQGPLMSDSESKNDANCCWLDNRTKGLRVVNAGTLVKTFSNESSFVTLDGAVLFVFYAVHPLAPDDVLRGSGRNEVPCFIGDEGIVFIFHGATPLWLF